VKILDLLLKKKENFISEFENFKEFCSFDIAKDLRKETFPKFYLFGLHDYILDDNVADQ